MRQTDARDDKSTCRSGEQVRAAQERVMYAAQLVESVDVKERKLVLGRKGKEEQKVDGGKQGRLLGLVGRAS